MGAIPLRNMRQSVALSYSNNTVRNASAQHRKEPGRQSTRTTFYSNDPRATHQKDARNGEREQPRGQENQRPSLRPSAQPNNGEATRNQTGAGRTDQGATDTRKASQSEKRDMRSTPLLTAHRSTQQTPRQSPVLKRFDGWKRFDERRNASSRSFVGSEEPPTLECRSIRAAETGPVRPSSVP